MILQEPKSFWLQVGALILKDNSWENIWVHYIQHLHLRPLDSIAMV